jgi:hypothetical protein
MPVPLATSQDWSWLKSAKGFEKDRNAAQNAQGALSAERTAEYNRSFAPVAASLRDVALSSYDPSDAASAAADAGKAYDVSAGALERQQRGMGVAKLAGQDSRLSLRRIISQVDAGNRAIDGADDRRTTAQMFSTDQYGELTSAAGSTYGELANQELNRKAQYTGAKASQRANIMQTAGTVASIAAMAFV